VKIVIETCNRYDCLRKFKADENDNISDFCDIVSDNKNRTIHNSTDCPFYCTKFYDYQLNKIITKHEDVHWISEDKEKDSSWEEHSKGLSKGLFVGISREGEAQQAKEREWEEKHENADTVVCPYCDYEYDEYENPYEDDEKEIKCENCGKTFICETNISYSWSTRRYEDDED
jgi:hypothetical protein